MTLLLLLLACAGGPPDTPDTPRTRTLTLAAYTTPREAYGKAVLPAFARHWKEKTGEELRFEESYQASGAQARAVKEGFAADVVALSLEPDIMVLEEAGLITHPWREARHGGIVTESLAVIAVRPGNPKQIADWPDLARADVEVLTPNVRTSGGAMWNILAMWGAAQRGHAAAGNPPSSPGGSVSAWRSRAPSRRAPPCCCSTSHSARWTPRSARSCVVGSEPCTTRCTRRRSSSPTTRRRRSPSRTAS